MNEKGFTLVELMAVIAVLAVIIVIAVPSILDIQNGAVDAISSQEEKNIKEAGRLVGIDLDDYTSSIYNCKESSWIDTSETATCVKKDNYWTSVTLDLKDLKDHDYFADTEGHCTGSVTIESSESSYKVTLNNVSCKK